MDVATLRAQSRQLLAAWMNSYLHADKMYVRDIHDDLHDGQLLLSFLGARLQRCGGRNATARRR